MNLQRSNSDSSGHSEYRWWLVAILAAVVVYYLPFVSRQFSGDDWLWLANAKRALTAPLIFLERPMYGYFRPLNMVLIFLQRLVLGNHAILFSLVSILLHSANVWLLWRVLERLKVSSAMRCTAVVLFAFYFLNAPAIEWISVAHDLWVTGLCLLVVLKSLEAAEKPSWSLFAQIGLLGMAATLIKESGFVSIGLFWAVLLLKGKSPLSRPFRLFTLLAALSYAAFLVGYSATRTVADREIALNANTIVNLWYFLVYLITPFAKRIVESVPDHVVGVLKVIKITATIIAPLCGVYLWRKGGVVCRLFLLWSIAFVATIAIMKWDVGLFDLYSEHTASRFMYSPVLGVSVCVAWLAQKIADRVRVLRRKYIVASVTVLFIAFNWLAVRHVSGLYLENQAIANGVIETFTSSAGSLATCDSVIVFGDDLSNAPALVASSRHLEAILYVWFDRSLAVTVTEGEPQDATVADKPTNRVVFRWDSKTRTFTAQDRRDPPLH
ncbi:MAG: hypothetical protein E4G91_10395 [Candidatus Zixiibacteriota bacterium]|nr:MAG: hypothetical protein E4G91_10395 [candidate division Zixibacteria bacterium]